MIFVLILFFVALVAFAEIGLTAFVVLPMTAVIMTGLVSFFAMFGGVEGAGKVFAWCAVITGLFFGALHLMSGGGR